ncbi:MAG: tetratricopeptide repeat protein [Verrucomicrobiota bacterium]
MKSARPVQGQNDDAKIVKILSACFEPVSEKFAGSRKSADEWLASQLKHGAAGLRLADDELNRQVREWAERKRKAPGTPPYSLALACFFGRDYQNAAKFSAKAYVTALQFKADGRISARAAARVWAEALIEQSLYAEAVDAYDKVLALTDRSTEALAWIQVLEAKAYALWDAGHYPAMEDALEDAVAARSTQEDLGGQGICYTLTFLAECYRRQMRQKEAQATLQEALNRMTKQPKISAVVHHEALCVAAQIASDLDSSQEAIAYLTQAVDLAEKTGSVPGLDPARARFQLSVSYFKLGRYQDAAEASATCISSYEKAGAGWERRLALSLDTLAHTQFSLGQHEEAIETAKRVVLIMEKAPPGFEYDLGGAYGLLGHIYNAAKKYPLSEKTLRRAVALREQKHGPDHHQVAIALGNLADVIAMQGRFAEAEPLAWDAMAIDMKDSVVTGRLVPGLVVHARGFSGIAQRLGLSGNEVGQRVLELARQMQMPQDLLKELIRQTSAPR